LNRVCTLLAAFSLLTHFNHHCSVLSFQPLCAAVRLKAVWCSVQWWCKSLSGHKNLRITVVSRPLSVSRAVSRILVLVSVSVLVSKVPVSLTSLGFWPYVTVSSVHNRFSHSVTVYVDLCQSVPIHHPILRRPPVASRGWPNRTLSVSELRSR